MLLKKITFFITIALLGSTTNVLATKLVLKDGDCNYKRDVFSNLTLQIVNGKLNMDMILVKILKTGLNGHMSFEFRRSKTKSYQSVFQHDVNYCGLLKGSQDSLYRHLLLSALKVGNFATSCPIQPGHYYLHDWQVNGNLVPSFFYLGDYRLNGSLFYGKYRKNALIMLECSVEAILS